MTDSLLHRTETLERAQRLLNSKASRTILGIVGMIWHHGLLSEFHIKRLQM